jgi:hypothetical protein
MAGCAPLSRPTALTPTVARESASSVHGSLPVKSERHMKKKSKGEKVDDLRPEYDLSELLKDGVQGKYADRFREGTNLVLLDRDIAEAFPSDEAVNTALRLVIQLKKLPRSEKRDVPKESDPAT